jgi:hypothetical protein
MAPVPGLLVGPGDRLRHRAINSSSLCLLPLVADAREGIGESFLLGDTRLVPEKFRAATAKSDAAFLTTSTPKTTWKADIDEASIADIDQQ